MKHLYIWYPFLTKLFNEERKKNIAGKIGHHRDLESLQISFADKQTEGLFEEKRETCWTKKKQLFKKIIKPSM